MVTIIVIRVMVVMTMMAVLLLSLTDVDRVYTMLRWQMLMVYVGIKVTWHSAAWTGPPSQAELTEKTRLFCFRFMIMVDIFTAIFIAISIMIISIVTCRVSIHSVCKDDPRPPQLCWCTSLKVAISITIVKPNEVKISTVMTLLGMKMAGWPPFSSTLLMHRRCVWS